jgi:hypothetical protein
MKSNQTISEVDLDRMLLCPILDPIVEDDKYICARQTLIWALRRTFDSHSCSIKELREKYVHFWNVKWFSYPNRPKEDGVPSSGSYWEGPKQGNKTAKKIFELFRLYLILQPEQPYELPIEMYTIQGEYAIIRRRGKEGIPMVLIYEDVERNHHSRPESTFPEPSSLARYIHVKNTLHEYKEVGIYHIPLIHGTPWTNRYIEEKLATTMLGSIIRVAKSSPVYATPGSHCFKCSSKPCLKVLNEKPQLYGI